MPNNQNTKEGCIDNHGHVFSYVTLICFKCHKDLTPPKENTSWEEKKKEIIGWMNYGIPRGKTIPNFEDLLDALLQNRDREIVEKFETALQYNVDHKTFKRILNALQALTNKDA